MHSKIEYNNKHKMCTFFVALGNGQALLGMSDIDVLNNINIIINSIGTEHGGGNDNCCTNKATFNSADMMQETSRTGKSLINNTLSNSVDFFIPGPSCNSDKKVST